MCGDYNGLIADDMRTPSDGVTQVTSDFVQSWLVLPGCQPLVVTSNDECVINSENSAQAELICARLRQGKRAFLV